MKIYDRVYNLLRDYPQLRDSDKKLMWTVWYKESRGNGEYITKDEFMKCTSAESITRARRKVVELHPELKGTREVERERKLKENTKGTFIYN